MSWDKDDLDARLTPEDRRLLFRHLGFSVNGQSPNSEGWISGILGPPELGEGKKPNFALNLRTGAVKDFGSSGYTGSLYDAVMDARGLSFPEAVDWVAGVLGLSEPLQVTSPRPSRSQPLRKMKAPSPPKEATPKEKKEPQAVVSLEAVERWHNQLMSDTPEAKAARSYLTGRGLSEGIIKGARLGLSRKPGRREGVRVEWWIVVPAVQRPTKDGEAPTVVGLKGFAFDPEQRDWVYKPDGRKIPRNAGPVALCDYVALKETAGPILVCEGELDALSALSYGFNAVTGTGGAGKFKSNWASYVANLGPAQQGGVVVCFDGDEKGRSESPKVARTLAEAGLSVHVADLPDGKDVNDVLLEGRAEALQRHIDAAEPYVPKQAESTPAEEVRTDEEAAMPREAFPIEALPGPLRGYVRAASEALPAPPEMVAVPSLAVIAGAIGNAARIRLKRSWNEPATLWTVIVAPSGSTKSPAFSHAVRPILRREAEAKTRYDQALADWNAQEDADERDKPTRRRYRTGDATPEAVVKILGDNPRGILLARDELGAWIGSFDRYVNGASDLQFWIEVWQGVQASRDRAGEGNTTVDRPAVPVTGTIQPGTLREKLDAIHFDTGFASRLILCQPPSTPKRWTEADVSREARGEYERLLSGLYATPSGTELTLSAEAKTVWVDFYNAANASLESRPEGPARAVAAKGITHVARLALIIHLCRMQSGEVRGDEVDAESMESALHLGQWLTRETLRVYDHLGLDRQAVPPIQRFFQRLPDEFQTAEAKAVADGEDIPGRTCEKWLRDLMEAGDLQKVKRGFYRKC